MGLLRLCIKRKQLLFLQYLMVFLLAARIIDTQHGDEAVGLEDVGAQCPGRDLLQQAVAGPCAGRAIGDAPAVVAQQIEAGVGQAAAHGLGPLVLLALAVAARVLRAGLDLRLRLLDAGGIDEVVRRIEGKALGGAVAMLGGQQAADGVVGVAGAAAWAGAGRLNETLYL